MAVATSADDAARAADQEARPVDVKLTVNGQFRTISVEPRTTLLDALRGQLGLTGTKRGCDRGECGACTVHIDGHRVVSCMTLAAMQEGKRITTIEGLERDGKLHPLQEAFIEHDGFQRLLHLRTDHVGRRHDRRGEGWLAERCHHGREPASRPFCR
jgi:xanthine dehydrogenase YagT iron-sulfur-binding subunit